MSESLSHRGPDDAGTWVDGDAGIAFGHRRLSVLDLSPAGHQPMISASGRYVVVFNGEIYNHLEIRSELELLASPPDWRGHSDTETLLSGVERWGVDSVLKKSVGMFAFALWDRQARVLTMARDRIGEKPLYYGWQGGTFLFGSELKALRIHPAFNAEIDRNVLTLYMQLGYIPAPWSIYQNIFKLLPGTYAQLPAREYPGFLPEPKVYWSLRRVAESGLASPFSGSDQDAIDELEAQLTRAVSLQSIADVSLGAFLSGGIDSSTVVALLQLQSSLPVKTFTIGFHESGYQEAEHARAIAAHLRTDHTELYATPRDAMDVIPKLPALYDEPFGDSSAIPTFLVSQLARRQVTVSLSGDGGDELFAGYTRYQRTDDIWRAMSRIPYFVRSAAAHFVGSVFSSRAPYSIGSKANRLALYLSARKTEEVYRTQTLHRQDAHDLVLGTDELPLAGGMLDADRPHGCLYDTMMYTDSVTYLPDDVLVKVDRASMGVGLEARVPMLDHRVIEFAWRLPVHMKVRNREGKWLLNQVLQKHVPASLVDRPKMGFGVPVGKWIRGPLREWAESLLSEERLKQDGFLNPRVVREQWSRHVDGLQAGDDSVWHLLAFQAWLSHAFAY
jgi:asparagine synthase (glutamine-hydrolysing)